MTTRTFTGRIPELDGLRGIAIAQVLIWHCVIGKLVSTPGSLASYVIRLGALTWSGVDLFFVLSGFLIGGILLDAKNSSAYYRTFYARRAFRILPVYVLMCVAPLALWLASSHLYHVVFGLVGAPIPWYISALFAQDFWFAITATWGFTYLGVTWSLAVEEQFYLALPVIVRKVSAQALLALSVITIIVAPFTRLLAWWYLGKLAPYVLVVCRADALMFGVLAAVAVRRAGTSEIFGKRTRPMLIWASLLLGTTLSIFIKCGWVSESFAMDTAGLSISAAFYFFVLLLALAPRDNLFRTLLRCPALMKLGNVAYCMYLIHIPVLHVTYYLLARTYPHLEHYADFGPLLASFALMLAIAAISWRYFERPLIGVGHRFRYKSSDAATPVNDLSLVHRT